MSAAIESLVDQFESRKAQTSEDDLIGAWPVHAGSWWRR